jgi:phytoene desaturase
MSEKALAKRKTVAVIGAGPGGLTAAMLLAKYGYKVTVYERKANVGGRNGAIRMNGFTFDIGPTFLLMASFLRQAFAMTGRRLNDYLDLKPIDPLYKLSYADGREFSPTHDRASMKEQIERLFPGQNAGYERFMSDEGLKAARLNDVIRLPYSSLTAFFRPQVLAALPHLDAHRVLWNYLGRYFKPRDLRAAFTFQAKYLGMSPWQAPATFSMLSFMEHHEGIFHPIGGLNAISLAMAKVIREEGGEVRLSTPIQRIRVEGKRATGVELESGEFVPADRVVLNADFAYAMNNLVDPENLSRWNPKRISKKGFSCSTFMLYLGVDKLYDLPHHNIYFAADYEQNVREVASAPAPSADPSFYVHNPSRLDPTMAPAGMSALYILVPVPNNRSGINWAEEGPRYRKKVLDLLETRAKLTDLRKHIVAERMITPADWANDMCIYEGATFNLAHNFGQMLCWRPHNQFEDINDCYLVGGGTHPGSGLPTIYESGRISAMLLAAHDGITIPPPPPYKLSETRASAAA